MQTRWGRKKSSLPFPFSSSLCLQSTHERERGQTYPISSSSSVRFLAAAYGGGGGLSPREDRREEKKASFLVTYFSLFLLYFSLTSPHSIMHQLGYCIQPGEALFLCLHCFHLEVLFSEYLSSPVWLLLPGLSGGGSFFLSPPSFLLFSGGVVDDGKPGMEFANASELIKGCEIKLLPC